MKTEEIISELEAERDRLNSAIAALRGNHTQRGGSRRGRHLSAAAKRRISEGMKAIWASRKRALKKGPQTAAA